MKVKLYVTGDKEKCSVAEIERVSDYKNLIETLTILRDLQRKFPDLDFTKNEPYVKINKEKYSLKEGIRVLSAEIDGKDKENKPKKKNKNGKKKKKNPNSEVEKRDKRAYAEEYSNYSNLNSSKSSKNKNGKKKKKKKSNDGLKKDYNRDYNHDLFRYDSSFDRKLKEYDNAVKDMRERNYIHVKRKDSYKY